MFGQVEREVAEREQTAVRFGATEAQLAYNAALTTLHTHRSAVERTFVRNLRKIHEAFLARHSYLHVDFNDQTASESGWELQLLDDTSLEVQLAFDELTGRVRRQYENQLDRIDLRMRKLASSGGFDRSIHPAYPKPLCDAFAHALNRVDAELSVKLQMVRVFEDHVAGQLEELYDAIDRALAGHADASLWVPRVGGWTNASPSPERGTQGASPEEAPAGQTDEERAPTDREGTSPETGTRPATAEQYEEAQQQAVRIVSASGTEVGADDVLRLVQDAVERTGAPSDGGFGSGGSGAGATSGVATIGADELMDALTRLQQSPDHQPADGVQVGQLKSELLEGIRQQEGEDAVGGIPETEENSIDLVSVLFDYLLRDPVIPDSIKGLVARLQMPVVKVALLEPSFFSSEDHPARALINSIGHAAVGMQSAEAQEAQALTEEIRRVVDWITNDFERDTQVFDDARHDFEERIEQLRARALDREQEAVDLLAQEEEREAAKRLASESINEIIGDNRLPETIDTFLRSTWKDLVAALYMRGGTGWKSFRRAVNIAGLLVWSLLPKTSREQRDELVRELPRLVRGIRSGMASMRLDDEAQQRILSVLADEHARNVSVTRVGRGQERAAGARATATASGAASDSQPAEDPTGQASPAFTAPARSDAEPATLDEGPANATDVGSGASYLTSASSAEAELEADKRSFIERKVAEIDRMVSERRWRDRSPEPVEPTGDTGSDDLVRQIRSMETGTWLQLNNLDDATVHAKLAWKGKISGEYYFFNRRGLQVAAMTENDLVAGLRSGTIVFVEEAPVVDRALDAMLAGLGTHANARAQ